MSQETEADRGPMGASDERWAALDCLDAAYLRLDDGFRITYLNRAAEALLGTDRINLVGRTAWEVFSEDDGGPLAALCRRAWETQARVSQTEGRRSIIVSPDGRGGLMAHLQHCDRLEPLTEHAEAGYYRIGADGRYEDVNPAFARMRGFPSPEEVVGQPFALRLGAERRRAAEAAFQRLLGGDPTARREFTEHLEGDAEAREMITVDLLYEDGRVIGVEGFISDTENLKLAEAHHCAVEGSYEALVASMAEGVVFHNADGRIGFHNQQALEILGLTAEQLTGEAPPPAGWSVVDENPDAPAGGPLDWLRQPPRAPSQRVIGVSKPGGTLTWASLNTRPIGGGRPGPGVITTFGDITASKAAEHRSREAERRYREIFDRAIEGIYRVTTEGRLLLVNPAFARMLGYDSPEQALASIRNISTEVWVEPDERRRILELVERHGQVADFEARFRRRDGQIIDVAVTSGKVTSPEGEVLFHEGSIQDITAKKRAQTALNDSLEAARIAHRAAKLGAFRWNAKTGRSYWSSEFMELYGLDPATVTPSYEERLKRLVHPDDQERADAEFRRVIESPDGSTRVEFRTRDGRWMLSAGQLYRDADGEPDYIVGIDIDITELKRAEEALRENERRYRSLFEMGDAMLFIDADTYDVLDANTAAVQLYGYSRDELRRLRLDEVSAEPDLSLAAIRRRDALVPLRWHRAKNGGSFPTEIHVAHFHWKGRNVLLAAVRNIAWRLRAEDELRRAHLFTRTILDTVDCLIVVADREGRIVHLNAACERLTGWDKDEAIGKRFDEVLAPGGEPTGARSPAGELDQRIPLRHETEWLTRDGRRRRIIWANAALRNASGEVEFMVGSGIDVTEQRRLEEELREAQKMESIGRLAAGVAHDFNNLLTVVNGNAALIANQLERTDGLWPLARAIGDAGARAARLTRHLLAFGQKQMFQNRTVNLNDVIREAEPTLRRSLGPDVALRLNLARCLGAIVADPEQIRQALVNVVLNARDAMPGGGRLTIETRNEDIGQDGAERLRDATPGPYVSLAVTDSGIGMEKAVLDRIFEPFFTTKAFGSSSGLGLSTVHGIVRQSGGWCDVVSRPEQGTRFTIYLPRTELGAAAVEAAESKTVLVVNRDLAVRTLMKAILSSRGYQVIEAGDAAAARRLAVEHPLPIQLAVIDSAPPQLDGLRLSGELKAHRAGLKVIFVTGAVDGVASIGDREAFVIRKPFRADDLLMAAADALSLPQPSPFQ